MILNVEYKYRVEEENISLHCMTQRGCSKIGSVTFAVRIFTIIFVVLSVHRL
jgi:hypothetical protein